MEKDLEIMEVSGIFAPTTNNNGVLLDPKRSGKMRNTDPYVPKELVQRFNVKKGQIHKGKGAPRSGAPEPQSSLYRDHRRAGMLRAQESPAVPESHDDSPRGKAAPRN